MIEDDEPKVSMALELENEHLRAENNRLRARMATIAETVPSKHWQVRLGSHVVPFMVGSAHIKSFINGESIAGLIVEEIVTGDPVTAITFDAGLVAMMSGDALHVTIDIGLVGKKPDLDVLVADILARNKAANTSVRHDKVA